MEEQWKDVVGFEGYYQVSNIGRVRSVPRDVMSGGFVRHRIGKIHSIKVGTDGYGAVTLYKHGKGKEIKVHRLVLEAFVGPCPEGMECRHFPDGSRMNNRVENLAWGTKKENTADRVAQGTQRYGELVSTHKLTDEAVIEIKELLRNGKTQVEIAHMFGVTRRVIGRILHGQSWKHVG